MLHHQFPKYSKSRFTNVNSKPSKWLNPTKKREIKEFYSQYASFILSAKVFLGEVNDEAIEIKQSSSISNIEVNNISDLNSPQMTFGFPNPEILCDIF